MIDIFDGSPKDKFLDIVLNANKSTVAKELENLIKKFVVMQEFCENNGLSDSEINLKFLNNQEKFFKQVDDVYIALTANILTCNE